jgi:hypothetical protein
VSTFTRGSDALGLTIGRPWSIEAAWTDPVTGAPVELTGFDLAAVIKWRGGTVAPAVALTNPAGGLFELTLAEEATALVPAGQVSMLNISFTDTFGDTHDFDLPIRGDLP